MDKPNTTSKGKDWLEAELADTLDEDYELELSGARAVDGNPQDLQGAPSAIDGTGGVSPPASSPFSPS